MRKSVLESGVLRVPTCKLARAVLLLQNSTSISRSTQSPVHTTRTCKCAYLYSIQTTILLTTRNCLCTCTKSAGWMIHSIILSLIRFYGGERVCAPLPLCHLFLLH
jgi:hypothetical protein